MTRVADTAAPVEMPVDVLADAGTADVVQRPDGWYWLADDGRQEVGPFASAAEARADMRTGQEGAEPGAALRETEEELGVSDWIDPETRVLAEDGTPHLEDH